MRVRAVVAAQRDMERMASIHDSSHLEERVDRVLDTIGEGDGSVADDLLVGVRASFVVACVATHDVDCPTHLCECAEQQVEDEVGRMLRSYIRRRPGAVDSGAISRAVLFNLYTLLLAERVREEREKEASGT